MDEKTSQSSEAVIRDQRLKNVQEVALQPQVKQSLYRSHSLAAGRCEPQISSIAKLRDYCADKDKGWQDSGSPAAVDSNAGDPNAGNQAALGFEVAGRIVQYRRMGKSSFALLQDGDEQVQLWLNSQQLGADFYDAVVRKLNRGDILIATGNAMVTKTGEPTISVQQLQLVAKCLRPLPEKFHGLQDVEMRYRQRELDLIVTKQARERLLARSSIIKEVRKSLDDRGYIEVETPMLHAVPSGASACSFETYHKALDKTLHLRISPELYLKRLLVGGLNKIYELNRCFRNEGVSARHNPEFTTVEIYTAWTDYKDAMDLTESVIKQCASLVSQSSVHSFQKQELDFAAPFKRVAMADLVAEHCKIEPQLAMHDGKLQAYIAANQLLEGKTRQLGSDWGKHLEALFEVYVEKTLFAPIFVTHLPKSISPLSLADADNGDLSERWELFCGGMEVANGFSELNDPNEQEQRFLEQERQRSSGDEEAMQLDASFVQALDYGMPCAAGIGLGLDRLVMLLTDANSIRDVQYFPAMQDK